MATPIQPTGKSGQKREARRQAKQVWEQLQPETWNGLSAAQKWEMIRRVLVYILRREFKEIN